ncbi:MAG: hypothetical protein PHW90_01655 [Bacilli bacterium]|nr:hypothetical protein [Bacilli bacterium]
MRRIKHFQGYGSVGAEVISRPKKGKSGTLIIKVVGNHECGLEINSWDKYGLAQWLGGPGLGKFTEKDVISFSSNSFYVENKEKNITEENCLYTIELKGN